MAAGWRGTGLFNISNEEHSGSCHSTTVDQVTQASSPAKIAPVTAITGFHYIVQGAKARVATKCSGTTAAADIPVASIIIRMGSLIASFHALVGSSQHLAALPAIRNAL